jgi:hypothetical protein
MYKISKSVNTENKKLNFATIPLDLQKKDVLFAEKKTFYLQIK